MKCHFCPNFQASQFLINFRKLKQNLPKNGLLILYIFSVFLWHNKLLFIHSIAMEYNFSNIAKKCQNFFARIFLDFVQIFDKSKLLGVRFHPSSYITEREYRKSNVSWRHRAHCKSIIIASKINLFHRFLVLLPGCLQFSFQMSNLLFAVTELFVNI